MFLFLTIVLISHNFVFPQWGIIKKFSWSFQIASHGSKFSFCGSLTLKKKKSMIQPYSFFVFRILFFFFFFFLVFEIIKNFIYINKKKQNKALNIL
jgi:hypothetical protein